LCAVLFIESKKSKIGNCQKWFEKVWNDRDFNLWILIDKSAKQEPS
jgi:hypothetical protein